MLNMLGIAGLKKKPHTYMHQQFNSNVKHTVGKKWKKEKKITEILNPYFKKVWIVLSTV